MVPLKEREMDFLDSSSAGVASRGAELTGGAAGDGTWTTKQVEKLKRWKERHKKGCAHEFSDEF